MSTLQFPAGLSGGKVVLFASTLTLLAACGGGGGGGDDGGNGGGGPGNVNVTDEQAKVAAQQSLANGLSGGLGKMQSVMRATTADNTLAQAMSDDLIITLLEGSESSGGSSSGVVDETEGVLGAFLGTATRAGDVITYTPDAHAICANDTIGGLLGAEPAATVNGAVSRHVDGDPCTAVISHMTLVQTLTSETSGTLAYKFDNFSPMVVGYSETSSYVQLNLADVQGALTAGAAVLDPDAPVGMPDMSGSVRLTATNNTATKSTLTLSIPEAASISGALDGEAVSIALAQTDKLIEMVGDTATNEASVEFAMNALDVVLPIDDDADVAHSYAFSMAGLTGLIQMAAASDSLTVTNLGLNGQPLTLKIDGSEALRVSLATMDMSIDGAAKTMTFGNGLDLSLSINNILQIWDAAAPDTAAGTLSFTAPDNTQLTVQPGATPAENVTKVTQGGPFDAEGTGIFTGALSVDVGSCFANTDDVGLPVVATTCP